MANWDDLSKRIPHRIRVGGRTYFEIVWVDSFPNPQIVGETRFDPKQIALKTGQSQKEATLTYLHEILHAVSDHYDIGLTETQVQALEKALPVLLSDGNLFTPKKRKK